MPYLKLDGIQAEDLQTILKTYRDFIGLSYKKDVPEHIQPRMELALQLMNDLDKQHCGELEPEQKLCIEAILTTRTLEGQPFTYPAPKHWIGKKVWWKDDSLNPVDWDSYVVAGVLLEQSFVKEESALQEISAFDSKPHWEYILADTEGIGEWSVQPRPIVQYSDGTLPGSYPTCDDLVGEEEYQQILIEDIIGICFVNPPTTKIMQKLTGNQIDDLATICQTYLDVIKDTSLENREDIKPCIELAQTIVNASLYGCVEVSYESPEEPDELFGEPEQILIEDREESALPPEDRLEDEPKYDGVSYIHPDSQPTSLSQEEIDQRVWNLFK